jgi:hypothetical protein
MRNLRLFVLLIFTYNTLNAQFPLSGKAFIQQANLGGGFPQDLLNTRSVVFYSFNFSDKELKQIQDYFQRTGIDAVSYFPLDMLTAGKDAIRGFYTFLNRREISNLVFAEKFSDAYRITITPFNGKEDILTSGQPAWSLSNRLLLEALKALNRDALASLKKGNLLINDFPETDQLINPITGKRNEFYAGDMKVDLVGIPKFGIDSLDQQLANILKEHFPFEYKTVEPGLSEKDLRKQGVLYVFCLMHTRALVARQLLQYPISPGETAYVSITFPRDTPQTKNIGLNTPVFKVYFKHIDSGNVFLGNKWDADTTWQQALINHIKAMKAELRLN